MIAGRKRGAHSPGGHLARVLRAVWLAALAGASSASAGVTVLSQSPEQIVFEIVPDPARVTPREEAGRTYLQVEIPGAQRGLSSGAPDLPWDERRVALPAGTRARALIEAAEWEPLAAGRPLPVPTESLRRPPQAGEERTEPPELALAYREDPAWYAGSAGYPEELVTVGASYAWRHYRVAPISVALVRYDPSTGELYRAVRLRVRVDFERETRGRLAAPARAYLHDEPAWDPIFRREILNYESARAQRTAPMPAARAAAPQRQGGPEFRISISATSLYRVGFEELSAAGWTGSELPWAGLQLLLRDYDDADEADPQREIPIAYLPDDLDGDGLFEAGESLIFYGEDAWDCFDLSPGDKRYGRENVYWLVAGGGAAVTMAQQPSWFGWTGLFPLLDFTRTMHFEENLYYMSILARDDTSNPDAGPQGIRTDHYNWTYPVPSEPSGVVAPIKTVAIDLPQLHRATEVCVHLQGQGYVGASTTAYHRPRLWLSRSAAAGDTTWAFPGNPYVVPPVDDVLACGEVSGLPVTTFGAGRNYVKIYLPRADDGIDDVDGHGIGIDWVEVTFDGRFEVQDHRLVAPLDGEVGRRYLLVRKLPSTEVRVFDVGDPRAPIALAVDPSQVVWSAANQSYDLKMQRECPAAPGRCEIVVVEGGVFDRVPSGGIRLRAAEPVSDFAGEDYVVIHARRFGDELDPLIALRESQGHVVFAAAIEDVFDTYGGGRRHPYAIKRLLRAMWRESEPAPEYLLLYGDASNDLAEYTIARATANSDTNFVTSITIPGHYFGATGTELVTCDHWFTDNLGGAWTDPLSYAPDLHVGRVSCGSDDEARRYVEKVLAYEQGDETAPWRRRILFASDDDFSSEISSLGSGGIYRRRAGEWRFLDISRNSAELIQRDSLFTMFTVDSLYLNAVMDSVPGLGRCELDPLDPSECARDEQGRIVPVDYSVLLNYGLNKAHGETTVRDLLISMLNRGALIYSYQGHSNRYLLTHEYIQQYYAPAARDDIRLLTNVDRPFVFLGFGCHLADFASHNEGDRGRGDAMVERMMFCCEGQGRAGIAAIASTDYETIGHDYEEKFFQALFPDPPQDASGRRRWRLGEVFSHSKSKLPARKHERLTYTLLGDPALRIGAAPPAVALRLNGEDFDPSGGGEYAPERDDDSLTVRIEVRDESTLGAIEVADFYGTVPPEHLEPILVDDRQGRRRALQYRTRVERRDYDLTVRALDYDGAERSVRVHLPCEAALFEQTGDELQPLPAGAPLASTDLLAMTLRVAAHLAPQEQVRLLAAGTPVALARAESVAEPSSPALWTLRFAELPGITEEEVTLEVQILQHDGEWRTLLSQTHPIGVAPLRIEDLAWVPNPFDGQSTLLYRLTAAAQRARLRIFTTSGREILEVDDLPALKGQRHYVWDGRDADGDPVANGLYFFELAVWDDQNRRADRRIDKLVRVR